MEGHIDALIAALPPTLAVIVSVIIVLRKQAQLHIDINGRLTELLKLTAKSSMAEGVEQERQRIK